MQDKLIQNHMKSPQAKVYFWIGFFSSKFSQAECIYKCCPSQPLEIKGLPFHRRCGFHCQGEQGELSIHNYSSEVQTCLTVY